MGVVLLPQFLHKTEIFPFFMRNTGPYPLPHGQLTANIRFSFLPFNEVSGLPRIVNLILKQTRAFNTRQSGHKMRSVCRNHSPDSLSGVLLVVWFVKHRVLSRYCCLSDFILEQSLPLDSNQYAVRHQFLRLKCLPIPPERVIFSGSCGIPTCVLTVWCPGTLDERPKPCGILTHVSMSSFHSFAPILWRSYMPISPSRHEGFEPPTLQENCSPD